jgi:hypothetical protein
MPEDATVRERVPIDLPPEGGGTTVQIIESEAKVGDISESSKSTTIAPAPTSEAAQMVALFESLIKDKSVDLDRIKMVLELRNSVLDRQAHLDFVAAKVAAQGEMPEIDKKGKIIIKDRNSEKVIQSTPYALWEDTNRIIKPILARHGLALSFQIRRLTEGDFTGHVETIAVLEHEHGHREVSPAFILPADKTGSKNDVQSIGSSSSYGKRYTACAMLNISTRGEDDDGSSADKKTTAEDHGPIDAEQLDKLRHRIVQIDQDTGPFTARFCKFLGIGTLEQMPKGMFIRALKELDNYERAVNNRKQKAERKQSTGKAR